jgi:hypothetical protein
MAVLAMVMPSEQVDAPQTAPGGGHEIGFAGAAFGGGADATGAAEVLAVDGVTPCSLLQAVKRVAARAPMTTAERKGPIGRCMAFSLLARDYRIAANAPTEPDGDFDSGAEE